MARRKFSSKASERLGHYVYMYVDPRDDAVFYVGKGTKNRCFRHLTLGDGSTKSERISELRTLGHEPRIEILRHGLTSDEAHHIESAAIDLLGLTELTNKVAGRHASLRGRAEVGELQSTLDAVPVAIEHRCILITINKNFTHGMSVHEIYDATRSAWVANPERRNPEYALSVFRGVIREVFSISAWVEGGTTMKTRDKDGRSKPREGRMEFVGQVAPDDVRRRYVGRSLAHTHKPGAQNPIRYENC